MQTQPIPAFLTPNFFKCPYKALRVKSPRYAGNKNMIFTLYTIFFCEHVTIEYPMKQAGQMLSADKVKKVYSALVKFKRVTGINEENGSGYWTHTKRTDIERYKVPCFCLMTQYGATAKISMANMISGIHRRRYKRHSLKPLSH
jgi:hypothetical protein